MGQTELMDLLIKVKHKKEVLNFTNGTDKAKVAFKHICFILEINDNEMFGSKVLSRFAKGLMRHITRLELIKL